ncbi:molybdate ABC transporter substrate-binding protein [Nocardioides terrisoli]|uniref:molybdate ABC transporter substrate-binding protein n=1 Tax=Nocardioides terrisoli TaxID=3388267 RepID=UPI00287BB8E9|nr:molybdate ABC transporter substrate-binding protein [Nocardioides marmorisolisilvae]
MRTPRLLAVPLAVALLVVLTGCGAGGGAGGDSTLTVLAAASLTEPFTAIAREFEKDHPGTRVVLSFGASDVLAQQSNQGAPADLLATASTTTMDLANDAEDAHLFASNTMEIAVPAGNPGHVSSLRDLTRPGVKVAVCQAKVPCGVVAAKVFARAHLSVRPVTEEADVRSVLTKVDTGEVDAGLVYTSDVRTAPSGVRGVPIPKSVNAVTSYPISVLGSTKHQHLAEQFEQFVLGPTGRRAMTAAGFARP